MTRITFAEFFEFYLKEHSDPRCRWWHFMGINAAIALAIYGFETQTAAYHWQWAVYALLVGYGLSIPSHWFIQGNNPASMQRPLWRSIPFAFLSDWKMWLEIWKGNITISFRRVA